MNWWMSYACVAPVVDLSVRGLCAKPYPGHNRGCPNFGKRTSCPPRCGTILELLDLARPAYVIFNAFDLAGHVARLRHRHPDWSERQLKCCLYWQGGARKRLREEVGKFLAEHPGQTVLYCPEACGVNVTATMASIGICLEWPPETVAYQVALAGAV